MTYFGVRIMQDIWMSWWSRTVPCKTHIYLCILYIYICLWYLCCKPISVLFVLFQHPFSAKVAKSGLVVCETVKLIDCSTGTNSSHHSLLMYIMYGLISYQNQLLVLFQVVVSQMNVDVHEAHRIKLQSHREVNLRGRYLGILRVFYDLKCSYHQSSRPCVDLYTRARFHWMNLEMDYWRKWDPKASSATKVDFIPEMGSVKKWTLLQDHPRCLFHCHDAIWTSWHLISTYEVTWFPGPHLLTWIKFKTSMDK